MACGVPHIEWMVSKLWWRSKVSWSDWRSNCKTLVNTISQKECVLMFHIWQLGVAPQADDLCKFSGGRMSFEVTPGSHVSFMSPASKLYEGNSTKIVSAWERITDLALWFFFSLELLLVGHLHCVHENKRVGHIYCT